MPRPRRTRQKEVVLLAALAVIPFLEPALFIQNPKVYLVACKGDPTKLVREISRLENRRGLHSSANQKLSGKEAGRTRDGERISVKYIYESISKVAVSKNSIKFPHFQAHPMSDLENNIYFVRYLSWYFSCTHKRSYNSLWNSLVEKGKVKVHSWSSGLSPKWW